MDKHLPQPLEFSQTSLQDYLECPRRFELSSLQETIWPAAHSAPLVKFEELTEMGTRFHQLCHQFFLGVDPDLIASTISEPKLNQLWNAFLPYGQSLRARKMYFEQLLRLPFQDHFLVAKYDLIVQEPEGQYLIIDWKTASKKPSKSLLANRVQTLLYPFIFQQTGRDLFDKDKLSPAEITMQYWYPQASDPEEVFPYSTPRHQEVSQFLSNLIAEIELAVKLGEPFPLTEDLDDCQYCIYRSYCERGNQASPLPVGADLENEDLSNTHFDIGLIKEVEY